MFSTCSWQNYEKPLWDIKTDFVKLFLCARIVRHHFNFVHRDPVWVWPHIQLIKHIECQITKSLITRYGILSEVFRAFSAFVDVFRIYYATVINGLCVRACGSSLSRRQKTQFVSLSEWVLIITLYNRRTDHFNTKINKKE